MSFDRRTVLPVPGVTIAIERSRDRDYPLPGVQGPPAPEPHRRYARSGIAAPIALAARVTPTTMLLGKDTASASKRWGDFPCTALRVFPLTNSGVFPL